MKKIEAQTLLKHLEKDVFYRERHTQKEFCARVQATLGLKLPYNKIWQMANRNKIGLHTLESKIKKRSSVSIVVPEKPSADIESKDVLNNDAEYLYMFPAHLLADKDFCYQWECWEKYKTKQGRAVSKASALFCVDALGKMKPAEAAMAIRNSIDAGEPAIRMPEKNSSISQAGLQQILAECGQAFQVMSELNANIARLFKRMERS